MKSHLQVILFLLLATTIVGSYIAPSALNRITHTPTAAAAAEGKNPNFLVIMGDDFGFSDIGAFGGEISTPNLDAIANEGKILTDYHTAPTCSPARASLLTGVDWHITGLGAMFEILADNQRGQPGYETYITDRVVTAAELLHDAGYHTYLSGKWHLSGQGNQPGSDPFDRGFEKSFSLLGDGANHFNDREYVPGYPVIFTENGKEVPRPGNNTVFETDVYANKLMDYINSTHADGKPFFGYLAFQAAHTPFQAPSQSTIDKYYKMYRSMGWDKLREQRFDKQKELGIWDSNMTIPTRYPPNQPWNTLSSEQQDYAAKVLAVHSAMIETMDKSLGRVIQYLKSIGQYDNTFIMFTSDNGSSEPIDMINFRYLTGVNVTLAQERLSLLNNSLANLGKANSDFNYDGWGPSVAASPLSGFKGTFYEGGVRVPFVVKIPQAAASSTSAATAASGSKNNIVKSFAFVEDITPTILDYAGVSHPATYKGHDVHPMTGKSLRPLLEGKVDRVYSDDEVVPQELFNQTSVRMGDWVGIHDSTDKTGVWKLFNLRSDLGENTNVADQHSDIVQKMKTAYDKYAQDVGVIIPRGGFPTSVAPIVNATNTETISLGGMFVPGHFVLPKPPNLPPD